MKRAVVFCSASNTIEPKYNLVAREVVDAACEAGYGIVSGGTIKGTMNVVATEAAAHEVENIGILPRFMKGLEHPGLTSLIWTDTMSERKEKMREDVNLVIALPGGIGTLDELAETYVLIKLGLLKATMVVLNVGGFYDGLIQLFDHYVETRMLDRETRGMIHFVSTVEEFKELING